MGAGGPDNEEGVVGPDINGGANCPDTEECGVGPDVADPTNLGEATAPGANGPDIRLCADELAIDGGPPDTDGIAVTPAPLLKEGLGGPDIEGVAVGPDGNPVDCLGCPGIFCKLVDIEPG